MGRVAAIYGRWRAGPHRLAVRVARRQCEPLALCSFLAIPAKEHAVILKQARILTLNGPKAPVLRLGHLPGRRVFRALGAGLVVLAMSTAGVAPLYAQENMGAPAGAAPRSQGRVEVIWPAAKADGTAAQVSGAGEQAGASGVAAATAQAETGQISQTGAGPVAGNEQARPSTSPQAVVPPAADLMVEEPWEEEPICPRDQVAPREYNRCLFDATRASEQALEAALGRAFAAISGRVDLAPAQRAAWRTLLEEAQYRFLIFRNFDCQSVAPFEGPRGIGNFEQRSLCLISTNRARAESLEQRYATQPRPATAQRQPARTVAPQMTRPATLERPAVPAPTAPAIPAGPEPQLGVWTYPTRPVVD